MIFDRSHAEAFAAASHDRNPLHLDAEYARRTPFGRPVVYGMASVLAALGEWSGGRPFRMSGLRIRFKLPIYFDEPYELRRDETDGTVKLVVARHGVPHTEISFESVEGSPAAEPSTSGASFGPLAVADDVDNAALVQRYSGAAFPYAVADAALPDLGAAFGVKSGQLPRDQLTALLWSSYFIGMHVPGRQALFVSADFTFSPPAPSGSWQADIARVAVDPRFHIAQISGTGSGIESFTLKALRRPKPVIHDLADIRAVVGASQRFAGKTVFISGAGRGFGAALAAGFALHGATVVANYRSASDELERLRAEFGQLIRPMQGDIGRAADCDAIARALRESGQRIDVLINNASPQIAAAGFLEQPPDEFLRFVHDSLGLAVRTCHALLPLMQPGGTVINVSSVYAVRPKPRFSHYVAAKGAFEGFTRALAVEYAEQRFVVLRPPRMLTDQTNIGFDLEPPMSTPEAVRRFLERLAALPTAPNFHELDLT